MQVRHTLTLFLTLTGRLAADRQSRRHVSRCGVVSAPGVHTPYEEAEHGGTVVDGTDRSAKLPAARERAAGSGAPIPARSTVKE